MLHTQVEEKNPKVNYLKEDEMTEVTSASIQKLFKTNIVPLIFIRKEET